MSLLGLVRWDYIIFFLTMHENFIFIILFIYLKLNNYFNLGLFWPIIHYSGVYFIIELISVD